MAYATRIKPTMYDALHALYRLDQRSATLGDVIRAIDDGSHLDAAGDVARRIIIAGYAEWADETAIAKQRAIDRIRITALGLARHAKGRDFAVELAHAGILLMERGKAYCPLCNQVIGA